MRAFAAVLCTTRKLNSFKDLHIPSAHAVGRFKPKIILGTDRGPPA